MLTISKIILINITTKLIKNALEALEALKLMVIYIFHSSNFCLKRRVSSLAKKKQKKNPTNPVCFPWIDSLISFIFKKMPTRHLSLNSHSLSDIVSSKNCSVQNLASSACNSNYCLSTLTWDNCHSFLCSRSILFHTFHFITLKGQALIKLSYYLLFHWGKC